MKKILSAIQMNIRKIRNDLYIKAICSKNLS